MEKKNLYTCKTILANLTFSIDTLSVYASILGIPDQSFRYTIEKLKKICNVIIICDFEKTMSDNAQDMLLKLINKKDNGDIYDMCHITLKDFCESLNNLDPTKNYGIKDINILFILYDWSEIIDMFKLYNINISGGHSTKRHILSLSQVRLSNILHKLKISIPLSNGNNLAYLSTKKPNGKRSYSTSKILYSAPDQKIDNYEIGKFNMFIKHSPFNYYIKKILNQKISLEAKQLAIEEFLHSTWIDFIKKKNPEELNSISFTFIRGLYTNFKHHLEGGLNNIKSSKIHLLGPLFNMDKDLIALISFKEIMPILNSGEKKKFTNLAVKIGEKIIKAWIINEYKKIKTKDILFIQFKEEILKNKNLTVNNLKNIEFNIGDFLLKILIDSGDYIIRTTEKIKIDDNIVWIEPTEKVINILKNEYQVMGFHLPMIIPPKDWGNKKNGGYILNNEYLTNELIHQSSQNSKVSYIKKVNLLYDAANYIQKIPFKINNKMLSFVLTRGIELDLILSNIHPLTFQADIKKKDKTMVEKHNNRYFLEKNILGIASLFSDQKEFYFPVYLDWWGRLYSICDYLSFQGNELSKCLLQFANGGIIKKPVNEFKYSNNVFEDESFYFLKIYGANCFGNGIDKKSYLNRIKWVDDNHHLIISMDLNFIKKAENSLLFTAFCYEYIECENAFIKNEDYITHLPIQLDASCNGIQHLSSIIGDFNLAKMVNLVDKKINEIPEDIYSECLKLVQDKIQNITKEEPLNRLGNLNLDRKMIKKSIMTIPYTVSVLGISEQLKEFFIKEYKDGTYFFRPINIKTHGDVWITAKELMALANIIHSTLYITHPRLKELVIYFEKMVSLLAELNLPIAWVTPGGLHINQKYIKFNSSRINHHLYKGSKAVTIRIPTEKINIKKQKQSIIPNLIHSLDASVIALMIKQLRWGTRINLFTVHDCFATTANHVTFLNIIVREAFLEIYSDAAYLNKLHDFLIIYISNNYSVLTNQVDKKVVLFNSKELEIPTPPKSGNYTNVLTKMHKAIYMIH